MRLSARPRAPRVGLLLVAEVVVVLMVMQLDGLVISMSAEAAGNPAADVPAEALAEACSVYCDGPILARVARAELYNDSKSWVDAPMRMDPANVTEAFHRMGGAAANDSQVQRFVDEYFFPVGSDIEVHVPVDYDDSPDFLEHIADADYRQWAQDINGLWTVLSKKVNDSYWDAPQRHSVVPRRYPMIVPGGRFRESYYWDSYWIIKGLLVCGMDQTAWNVIGNLVDDVDRFGFVPNGGRIYFSDRSQPPLLTAMVVEYFQATNNFTFVRETLDTLDTEYAFWMNEDNNHVVTVSNHTLNRYWSNASVPRPEEYLSDEKTANESSRPRNTTYHAIRSGAETGWDFSSRFIRKVSGVYNLSNIVTPVVVPVELNAYLYSVEVDLARLHEMIDRNLSALPSASTTSYQSTSAQQYYNAAVRRSAAIQAVLWDEQHSRWRDYVTDTEQFSDINTVASFLPLWVGLPVNASDDQLDSIATALNDSGLVQAGGVLTTNLTTSQQWDSPDAWPPLIDMIVTGLRRADTELTTQLGTRIAQQWVNTNYLAYKANGYMYEKYNAYEVGVGGGGGEYTPQIGFGWTNGVALSFLVEFYSDSTDDNGDDDGSKSGDDDNSSSGDGDLSGGAIAGITIAVVFVIAGAALAYRRRHREWQTLHEPLESESENAPSSIMPRDTSTSLPTAEPNS